MLSSHFKRESIILPDSRYQTLVFVFLSATWLAHGKLFSTIEGLVSLIQYYSLYFNINFKPEGHWEPHNKVG